MVPHLLDFGNADIKTLVPTLHSFNIHFVQLIWLLDILFKVLFIMGVTVLVVGRSEDRETGTQRMMLIGVAGTVLNFIAKLLSFNKINFS